MHPSSVNEVPRFSVVLLAHTIDVAAGFVARAGPVLPIATLARATGLSPREIEDRLRERGCGHRVDAAIARAIVAESSAAPSHVGSPLELRALRPARSAAHADGIVLPLWTCARVGRGARHGLACQFGAHASAIERAADDALDRALARDPFVVRLFARGEPLRVASARALMQASEESVGPCGVVRVPVIDLLPERFTHDELVSALALCASRVARFAPHREAPDERACRVLAWMLEAQGVIRIAGAGGLRFECDALRAWLERDAGVRWRRPWSVYRLRRAGVRRGDLLDALPRSPLRWRDAGLVDEAISRAIGSGAGARTAEPPAGSDALAALGLAIDRAEARASSRDARRLAAIEACAARLAAHIG